MAVEHFLPGERRRPSGEDVLDGRRRHRQRPRQGIERGQFVLHADKSERQRPRQAAQAGIAGKRADQRGGLAQPLCQARHVVGRTETAGHCGGKSRLPLMSSTERNKSGCPPSALASSALACEAQLRRRGVDDHQSRLKMAGKHPFEVRFALAPVEIGRDQFVDIGADGEMPGRIDAGSAPQRRAKMMIGQGNRVQIRTMATVIDESISCPEIGPGHLTDSPGGKIKILSLELFCWRELDDN